MPGSGNLSENNYDDLDIDNSYESIKCAGAEPSAAASAAAVAAPENGVYVNRFMTTSNRISEEEIPELHDNNKHEIGPISSMDKMIVTIGSNDPNDASVYSGRLLIEVAGQDYPKKQAGKASVVQASSPVYSNDTLERGLSSDFPDDSLERPRKSQRQKNSSKGITQQQQPASQEVVGQQEQQQQQPKDYSFRLFENGQLVTTDSSTQSSLQTCSSMTSDTSSSATSSQALSSIPPALPPKKSKHSGESIYENAEETAAVAGPKRSIAERKQYFEALSASQENVSIDTALKTNNNNTGSDFYDDDTDENQRRAWPRNF